MQQRGRNRLTRDNAGRIQGIGGSGATARGGRLKTASGKQRGTVLMKAQGQGRLRGGKGAGGGAGAKSGVGQAKKLTQKEKWAKRAELLRQQADRADARGQSIYDRNRRPGDNAFWTQPGLGKQRDKARAAIGRAFDEQKKAERLRQRAANLEQLANTNKGDAARRRVQRADAIKSSHKGLKKGDTIEGVLYGRREVVKVNAKSVTVKGDMGNFTIPWEHIKPRQR